MTTLADQLADLGLRATAAGLDDLIALAAKKRFSHVQLLETIADREIKDRARRSVERRLACSKIGRFKPMADFDWSWPDRIDRDAVDRRIVSDVRKGRGRLIDSPAEVGGLGAVRTTHRSLSLPTKPAGDADGDGYSNLEEWLHCMAAKVERRSARGDCPGPFDDAG